VTDNTPVEVYPAGSVQVLVKREDLCCPYPGPPFSKMRGVFAHVKAREEHVIGVLDTHHSKAGWAVSYACHMLMKETVNYWPRRKGDGDELRPAQLMSQSHGAQLVALSAGRSAILYHRAKKDLRERFPDCYMMPNALKLPESVTENAAEAERTDLCVPTLVISISSGTVAAGVIRGLHRAGRLPRRVIFHMGYSRSVPAARAYISQAAGLDFDELERHGNKLDFVDEGYSYADRATGTTAPFPCNLYYDLKAWKWLQIHAAELSQPILFWNIGD
jgi:hypothetical protein